MGLFDNSNKGNNEMKATAADGVGVTRIAEQNPYQGKPQMPRPNPIIRNVSEMSRPIHPQGAVRQDVANNLQTQNMRSPVVGEKIKTPEPLHTTPEQTIHSGNDITQKKTVEQYSKPSAPTVEEKKSETAGFSTKPIIDASSHIMTLNDAKIECELLGTVSEYDFSDVWVTPDKLTYIWGGKTNAGLKWVRFADFDEFFVALQNGFDGENRSYLLQYKGRNFRVERTISYEGPQYCARKMPVKVPDLKDLGMPKGVYNYMLSLAGASGLILLAGATGSGKSTTIAALMKEFLKIKGGYAYTIEDPIELPLDGLYLTPDNEIGLCKQTTPPGGSWEEGIKSALRSKPRYIYLGEIRSPDIASEALRAATSGHLVLSSIHANNVSEAINALVKYAGSTGISEAMAYELVAGGFLACIHQILSGAPKRAHMTTLFANPDGFAGCQVRGMIRCGKLNMATIMEQQRILLEKGAPLFG